MIVLQGIWTVIVVMVCTVTALFVATMIIGFFVNLFGGQK